MFTASLTEQITVVVPFTNAEPEDGAQIGTPTAGQLSLTAGAEYETTAVHKPGAAGTEILAGQTIEGGWVSLIVTENEHEAILLDVSVAVQLTVVVPFGNVLPEGGVQALVTPGQLSLAVGSKLTTAEH